MPKHYKIQKIKCFFLTFGSEAIHTLPLHNFPSPLSSYSRAQAGYPPHSSPPSAASHPCPSHSCGFSHIVSCAGNSFPHLLHLAESSGGFQKTCLNFLFLWYTHMFFSVTFYLIWIISQLYVSPNKLYVIYLLTGVSPPPKWESCK